ncbi:hypothetical protein KAR28_01025 [Candidatus Parcubacteria bacterium]|nr:hypothetical protein [Candidatus Parcubacteria bacterium]
MDNEKEQKAVVSRKYIQLIKINAYKFFNLIVVTVAVLILAVGFLYILRPKYNNIVKGIQLTIEEKENDKTVMERYITRLKSYQKSYNSISIRDKEAINKMIPEEYDKEELFAYMDNLAKHIGLTLNAASIMEDKKKLGALDMKESKEKEIQEIEMSLNFSGVDYRGLKQILTAFENSLRLIDVQTVAFSPDDNSLAVELTTYYIK